MSKRKEDDFPPATEQKRARPEPSPGPEPEPGPGPGPGGEGTSEEGPERAPPQNLSLGSSTSHSVSGEFGVIESIQVENFMGYTMLGPVKFGSNVNFMVGHSGKNALLTALVVGLGGKSLGTSLKGLIKDGETSADISITLRNRGDYAFKSDLYGDSITVHQHISIDESETYELKSHTGDVVSSKKEDLTAILERFKIQVDNPVSILREELSRQLMDTRNDGDRYKLFMKATELEQMREDYSQIMERKARNQHQIEQGEEQLEELKRQGIEIEEHFQNMVTLRKKLEDLKNEMAWALVSKTEREIDNMIGNISIGDQRTVILNQELEASKVKFSEAEKKYRAIHENMQKLSEEAAELEPQCIEANEDAMKTDRAYCQAEAFYNYSQNEFNKLDQVSEQLHNQIDEMKKSLELAELEKQNKISMLKEKIRNFKDQEDTLVEEIKHLHQAIEKDDKEHSQIREQETYMQQILDDEQRQLDQLKDCKSEPLKRFGPQIPALLEAIEDAHRQGLFTYKPIGPLGACIRVREPEFTLAIESCLKGLLLSFFCDNHNDEKILQGLMKKFYPSDSSRPQIITSAFACEVYDLTDRMAYHPEFPTVLTALEIDNAVVANTLIDMKGIESVLLIKSKSLACTVMQAQRPPKNCTKVLTGDGDQVFERHYYTSEKLRPIYLGDIEMEISNLEKDVKNKIEQLSAFQEHVCSLEKDVKKNRETIDSHYQHLKEIKIKVISFTSEMKDLEEEEQNQSIDISILEDEAQEIKEEMKEAEEKMKIRKVEMEKLRQPKIDAEKRNEELKVQYNQISELVESIRGERNRAALEVDNQHQCMLHYENRLKQHLDSLQVKKEELAMKERELERETAQAKYICPDRKEVTHTASVLDREISLLRQRIQSENYTHRSREDIMRQYQEAKERYLDLDNKVKNLKKLIKTMEDISKQRYEAYQKRRRNLSIQGKLYFDSLLSQWSFHGDIHFDHINETLSVMFNRGDAAFNDLRASAGERHYFSNFLLIITLWSITESPFRCLDTFDVCLDSDHRKIAMDMILRIAHSQEHLQFILITPQYMNSVLPNSLIEVLQIPDPDEDGAALTSKAVSSEEEE
ncbi:structural maintenance of chromosomes protein 6-like [Dromiciops gliroides]|uniref:structural maintenance of chromosomes protein 6-like n=1 Tax=Dromiciops gliroides TaxID=33562 RepID=UPI001CC713F3|nr:structural maintenance of chromosomes protein 6-like [Dromiciops gliroides]